MGRLSVGLDVKSGQISRAIEKEIRNAENSLRLQ